MEKLDINVQCRSKGKSTGYNQRNDSSNANVISSNDAYEISFSAKTYSESVFPAYVGKLIFCLDSGATEHMVNDESYLSEVKLLKTPINIASAKNGAMLTATKIGKIYGSTVVNGTHLECKIEDVLFVNNLNCNLFSISKIESTGMKIVFNNRMVEISCNGKIVGQGTLNGKLYEIHFSLLKSQANVCNRQIWNCGTEDLGTSIKMMY